MSYQSFSASHISNLIKNSLVEEVDKVELSRPRQGNSKPLRVNRSAIEKLREMHLKSLTYLNSILSHKDEQGQQG